MPPPSLPPPFSSGQWKAFGSFQSTIEENPCPLNAETSVNCSEGKRRKVQSEATATQRQHTCPPRATASASENSGKHWSTRDEINETEQASTTLTHLQCAPDRPPAWKSRKTVIPPTHPPRPPTSSPFILPPPPTPQPPASPCAAPLTPHGGVLPRPGALESEKWRKPSAKICRPCVPPSSIRKAGTLVLLPEGQVYGRFFI